MNEHSVNDELEALLCAKSNRVVKRRFRRLITKQWPLTPPPDPVQHPRLATFVREYEAKIAGQGGPVLL